MSASLSWPFVVRKQSRLFWAVLPVSMVCGNQRKQSWFSSSLFCAIPQLKLSHVSRFCWWCLFWSAQTLEQERETICIFYFAINFIEQRLKDCTLFYQLFRLRAIAAPRRAAIRTGPCVRLRGGSGEQDRDLMHPQAKLVLVLSFPFSAHCHVDELWPSVAFSVWLSSGRALLHCGDVLTTECIMWLPHTLPCSQTWIVLCCPCNEL